MNKSIRPFPVLIKALLLFLAINLVYAWIDPSPAKFTLINHLLPGFERFPVIRKPETKGDGSVGIQTFVISNLDISLSAHKIVGTPKPADEYRVVLLGDSSMWGSGLTAQQTLVGIFNQAGLETCTGQKIHFYSLGYPGLSAAKDLLIMGRSDDYSPDMFLWTFSLWAFNPKEQTPLIVSNNLTDYWNLVQRYNLDTTYELDKSLTDQNFWDKTLWGQRQKLHFQLQINGFYLSRFYYGTDHIDSLIWKNKDLFIKPPGSDTLYDGHKLNTKLFKNNKWLRPFDTLRVAHEIANGRPLLLINEPIFITTGENSDIRYNFLYPRWAFDQFRDFIKNRTSEQKWIYRDYWDLLPQTDFFDSSFHRNAQGTLHLAEILIPDILQYACK